MASLKTTYLGIEIDNPIIVSSSGLTDNVEKLVDIEEAGAGAVVLKSLFEEQIMNKADVLMGEESYGSYPESFDYINAYIKSNDIDNYINLIKEAKARVKIPVIASINCVSADGWIDFAKRIEEAGADALEVNVFVLPTDKFKTSTAYEEIYTKVATKLANDLNMPFTLKIGSYFTNLPALADNIRAIGAKGIVMFNRFFEPDIDIDNLEVISADRLSFPSELRKSLRWIGIISDKNNDFDLAASTGVHDGEAAIKMLLVGAQAVQICSAVYSEGLDVIDEIKADILRWMEEKNFDSIEDFRYKLNYSNVGETRLYERSQFMKYYSNATEVRF